MYLLTNVTYEVIWLVKLQVNGIDITVAPHDQAVALLTGIRGEISLVVSRDQSDIQPQLADHGSRSTVTWPTTPLDAGTQLPIIVQPPTPNYATVESPSNVQQPPAIAKDSFAAADVEIGSVADVTDQDTADLLAELSEPLEQPDLIDLNAPLCETVTSLEDVILDVQQRTTEMMCEDIEFDIDDDDFGGSATMSMFSSSLMSSDIKDMIQNGMLETLRLL